MTYSDYEEDDGMNPILRGVLIAIGTLVVIGIAGWFFFLRPAFQEHQQRAETAVAVGTLVHLSVLVEQYYRHECEFPPDLPETTDPDDCCGDAECTADPEVVERWDDELSPSRHRLRSDEFDDGYFAYEAEQIDDGTYQVRAVRNVSCEQPNETVIREVVDDSPGGPCVAESKDHRTENEGM